MKPSSALIKITDNIRLLEQLISELVIQPRINALKWSKITHQTPNIKIGYPGQHLASLITGMPGERTGARGNDLIDGSEVKSCSRIDQLDKCNDCGSAVARVETNCPLCNSINIKRNNDSKWLFSIRNEDELKLITKNVQRVLLVLGDYPNFEVNDFNTLQFKAFEIWPQCTRNKRFPEILSNYYYKIYLEGKRRKPDQNPAPKNFWPYQYQFYMCNPIQTFSCTITGTGTNPKIEIKQYVAPDKDRSDIESIIMPPDILSANELDILLESASKEDLLPMLNKAEYSKVKNANIQALSQKQKRALFIGIDERLRNYLPLRDTDRIATAKEKYSRRKHLTLNGNTE